MASAVVVLKREISTLRQSHNCISIHFIFGVGDYVREATSPTKFGSDERSRRHVRARYTGLVSFIFKLKLVLQQNYNRYPLTFFHAQQLKKRSQE